MEASAQVPVEELLRVQSKIQSLMDDTNAVIMHAQSANDSLMNPSSFSGPAAVASAMKSAEITEAGQQVKNNLIALGENLGIASSHWTQQAADAAQLIGSTGADGIQQT